MRVNALLALMLSAGVNVTPRRVNAEEAERSHILHTLEQTEGVVGSRDGAAVRLGLPQTSLISKMRRLGISRFQRKSALARAKESVA